MSQEQSAAPKKERTPSLAEADLCLTCNGKGVPTVAATPHKTLCGDCDGLGLKKKMWLDFVSPNPNDLKQYIEKLETHHPDKELSKRKAGEPELFNGTVMRLDNECRRETDRLDHLERKFGAKDGKRPATIKGDSPLTKALANTEVEVLRCNNVSNQMYAISFVNYNGDIATNSEKMACIEKMKEAGKNSDFPDKATDGNPIVYFQRGELTADVPGTDGRRRMTNTHRAVADNYCATSPCLSLPGLSSSASIPVVMMLVLPLLFLLYVLFARRSCASKRRQSSRVGRHASNPLGDYEPVEPYFDLA